MSRIHTLRFTTKQLAILKDLLTLNQMDASEKAKEADRLATTPETWQHRFIAKENLAYANEMLAAAQDAERRAR